MRNPLNRKIRPDHAIGACFLTAPNNTLTPDEIKAIFEKRLADDEKDEMARRVLNTFGRLSTYIWCLTNNPRFFEEGCPTARITSKKLGKTVLSYTLENPQCMKPNGHIKCKADYVEEEWQAKLAGMSENDRLEIIGLMDKNPNNDDRREVTESPLDLSIVELAESNDPETVLVLDEAVRDEVQKMLPQLVEEVAEKLAVEEEERGVSVSDMIEETEGEEVSSEPVDDVLTVSEEQPVVSEFVVSESDAVSNDEPADDDLSAEAIARRNKNRRERERRAAKKQQQTEAA